MASRFRSSALLALAAVAALTLSSAVLASGTLADPLTQTYPVGVNACEHPTQELCTPASTVSITTDGVLRAEFVASPNHCSSVIAHLLVDGVARYASDPLGPGQSTGSQELGPVAAGAHQLGVQAEGVVGGCNAGGTASWAGSLTVVTSGVLVPPASAVAPTPTAGPLPAAGTVGSDYGPLVLGGGALLIAIAGIGWLVLRRRFGLTSIIAPPQAPDASLTGVIAPPQAPDASLTGIIAPPQAPDASLTGIIAPPQAPAQAEPPL